MQNYKEINGNDYVKDSRTTINETMRSIQSMNSGTVFPTNNLFEGMKCYRTDLKKTYTLTDVENNTWVEDDTASKLSTARKINITGDATGAAAFDGSSDISINATVSQAAHATAADRATQVVATAPTGGGLDVIHAIMGDNDAARVRVYGDANNGALEIATGDDGTEPIYARQYVNSSIDKFTTVARTAAILDGNGNTSFPGTVTAANFTGPLNGNATSATAAGNVSGKIYYSGDSPSVATDKLFTVKQAHAGDDNVPNNGLVIQSGPNGAAYNGKLYITDNGNDGVWVGGVAEGKEVGWKRLVENWGSWNINSATATKLAGESGSNYLRINTTTDNWNVLGSNPGVWLKSIRTDDSAPPYSIGHYSAAVAFGGDDTKGIITHAFDGPLVKFAGGNGSTAQWKFSIHGGRNNETYDLNNFPTKTGSGASGTWPISISGNADTVDGYHASDLLGKITAANTGGIVAASLTENGYVKFANGLILQWGFVSNTRAATRYNITFPVSFASACFGVHNTYFKSSGEAGKSGDNWDTVANITKYGCQLSADNQNAFWTAIGV